VAVRYITSRTSPRRQRNGSDASIATCQMACDSSIVMACRRSHGGAKVLCGFAASSGFRGSMEDTYCIYSPISDDEPDVSLFACFDGHGGKPRTMDQTP
jgi:hypothetical protein